MRGHRGGRQRPRQDRHAQRRQQPLRLRDHRQRPHAQLLHADERQPRAASTGRTPPRTPSPSCSPARRPDPALTTDALLARYPSPSAGHPLAMARPLWKGAISFGLVTIPVNVFSATRRDELRFRQLDRRDNTPITREAGQRGDRRRGGVGRHRQGLRVRRGLVRRARPGRLQQGQRQGHGDDRHRAGRASRRRAAAVLREAAVRGARQGRHASRTTSCARRCCAPAGSPSR